MVRHNTTYSSRPNRASRAAHEQAKIQYPTYDTSLIKPKKSKKPKIIALVVVLVLVVVAIAIGIFACMGFSKTLEPGKTVEVTIEEGSSASEVAEIMSREGVVENQAVFSAAVVRLGANSKLKSGVYIFEGGKSVDDYVLQLCDGPESSTPKIVVSEGMCLKDIASLIEKKTDSRIKAQDFIEKTSNASKYVQKYSFLKDVGNRSLEGFLFPKSYSVNSKTSLDEIIQMMLDQFETETKGLDYSYAINKGLNTYDVVKLASIVEKESAEGLHQTIAGVFYNRLDRHMYLNSDATTAYEVGHNPSPEEVHRNSEYSTYTNYGLPPTPICSPSLTSIKAVCQPQESNYLFFYFKTGSDGKVQYKFSETYDQHQQAIAEMR